MDKSSCEAVKKRKATKGHRQQGGDRLLMEENGKHSKTRQACKKAGSPFKQSITAEANKNPKESIHYAKPKLTTMEPVRNLMS